MKLAPVNGINVFELVWGSEVIRWEGDCPGLTPGFCIINQALSVDILNISHEQQRGTFFLIGCMTSEVTSYTEKNPPFGCLQKMPPLNVHKDAAEM